MYKWTASDIPRHLAAGAASECSKKNIPYIGIPCGLASGSLQLILMLFMFLYLPAFSYGQPSIHFTEVRHDFGTVGHDDKPEYIFEFSNTGNQPLIIEKISPS